MTHNQREMHLLALTHLTHRLGTMSRAEFRASLIAAGIYDADGNLTAPYRNDPQCAGCGAAVPAGILGPAAVYHCAECVR